jgi:hypothetical protein
MVWSSKVYGQVYSTVDLPNFSFKEGLRVIPFGYEIIPPPDRYSPLGYGVLISTIVQSFKLFLNVGRLW